MQYRLPVTFLFCFGLAQAGVVDLGNIVWDETVSAALTVSGNFTETYFYEQQLFTGASLNMTLDSGMTVAQELAFLEGPAYNGILVYNFPFSLGASGAYSQNGAPAPESLSPGNMFSFTATSQSGTVYSGFNNLGATIMLDPTNLTTTYETILGNTVTIPASCVASSTTTVTLPPLGTSGGNTYVAEGTFVEWQASVGGACTSPSGTPEPSTIWLVAAACGALHIRRRLRAHSQDGTYV